MSMYSFFTFIFLLYNTYHCTFHLLKLHPEIVESDTLMVNKEKDNIIY